MSNNVQLQQSLLDSIQILTESAIKNAGLDLTIRATVVSKDSVLTGKHTIFYEGGNMTAYSLNPYISYEPGARVYVLVPEKDFTKDKLILGLTSEYLDEDRTYSNIWIKDVDNNLVSLQEKILELENRIKKLEKK